MGVFHRTFCEADSGRRTPPTDLVGGTIFSTKTRSRRGINLLADIVKSTKINFLTSILHV